MVPRFLSGSGVKVLDCLGRCLVLGWVLVLLASAWVLGLAVACLRLGLRGTLFVGGLTKDFCDGSMFVLSFGPQKWDLREGPILHFGFVTFFVLCFRVSCTVLASSCGLELSHKVNSLGGDCHAIIFDPIGTSVHCQLCRIMRSSVDLRPLCTFVHCVPLFLASRVCISH